MSIMQMMISGINPGSIIYSTPGTYSFTVPRYNTLLIKGWSGGGGGQGAWSTAGTSGTLTSFLSMTLNGGTRGTSSGGAGGTVVDSGTLGTRLFTPGNNGFNPSTSALPITGGAGGTAPNGGTGGIGGSTSTFGSRSNGLPGIIPGAGGGGFAYINSSGFRYAGGGGGSGAYGIITISYTPLLLVGTVINIVVGAKGTGGVSSTAVGGNGADGRVEIYWS